MTKETIKVLQMTDTARLIRQNQFNHDQKNKTKLILGVIAVSIFITGCLSAINL